MSISARSRLLLAQYGIVFAIILLFIGVLALGVAWQTHSHEEYRAVTQEVDVEEYGATTQTEAVVDPAVNPELYEAGETLIDMPVYFFNESPVLNVIVHVDTPSDVAVDIDARLKVEIEAQRDEEVFWDHVELLAFESTTTTDGEAVFEGSKDMREVKAEIDRINQRIGTAGHVAGQLVLEIDYESTRYSGSLTTESAFVFTEGAFWLSEPIEVTHRESHTETIEEPIDPDLGVVALFGIGGIVLLLLALGIFGTLRREIDIEELETDLARTEHAEWISNGEIPTRGEKEFVGIDSLVDLVDIAIDSNKRVIYDTNIDTYAVIEGDLVYFYSPSREEIEEWLGV